MISLLGRILEKRFCLDAGLSHRIPLPRQRPALLAIKKYCETVTVNYLSLQAAFALPFRQRRINFRSAGECKVQPESISLSKSDKSLLGRWCGRNTGGAGGFYRLLNWIQRRGQFPKLNFMPHLIPLLLAAPNSRSSLRSSLYRRERIALTDFLAILRRRSAFRHWLQSKYIHVILIPQTYCCVFIGLLVGIMRNWEYWLRTKFEVALRNRGQC